MKQLIQKLGFSGCALLLATAMNAQPDLTPLSINLEVFATGLQSPLAIKNTGVPGDTRLFVCEQSTGRIRILDENGNITGTFANFSSSISTGSERGLLGLTFDPDYATNGYFYVNYTNNQGNTEVRRFNVSQDDPDAYDASTSHLIIRINQPFSNHNAGDLAFGPDGYLYIPMGDGGSGGDPNNLAQNTGTLLGKMLRIDVYADDFPTDPLKNYAIPPDNPFVNNPSVLNEIWAIGLRNPWRFAFDRETNDIWIADVGQSAFEEIHVQPASSTGGENYGWRCYEGNAPYNTSGCQPASAYTFPIIDFSQNALGWCSISGGHVYRGAQYPLMWGKYIVTDYCNATFYAVYPDGADDWADDIVNTQFTGGFSGFVGFGEDVEGELYAVRLNNGTIYRVTEPCSSSIPTITEDSGTLTSSPADSYQWMLNGEVIEGATSQNYEVSEPGDYSVIIDDGDGCVVSSQVLTVFTTGFSEQEVFNKLDVHPNPGSGIFVLSANVLQAGNMNIEVMDQTGRMVRQFGFGQVDKEVQRNIDLTGLSEGVYMVRVFLNESAVTRRVVIAR
jgi:glucose/arabinose dehydrogenase